MELERIDCKLTVCKVTEVSSINLESDFYFIGKTDEEVSLVCKTEDTPMNTIEREDGWRGFRIQGVPDSLYFHAYNDSRTPSRGVITIGTIL